jgi:hypothetical protein
MRENQLQFLIQQPIRDPDRGCRFRLPAYIGFAILALARTHVINLLLPLLLQVSRVSGELQRAGRHRRRRRRICRRFPGGPHYGIRRQPMRGTRSQRRTTDCRPQSLRPSHRPVAPRQPRPLRAETTPPPPQLRVF